jgi:hypothetical protein
MCEIVPVVCSFLVRFVILRPCSPSRASRFLVSSPRLRGAEPPIGGRHAQHPSKNCVRRRLWVGSGSSLRGDPQLVARPLGLLVCSSVFALRFMTNQEYHRPSSPSLAPFASFDLSSFEAQLRHILSTPSGSARCSESVSESRAVIAAGLPSFISVSAVPTMDSTRNLHHPLRRRGGGCCRYPLCLRCGPGVPVRYLWRMPTPPHLPP